MKKAIVIYPVLENLDKNLIENKLIETCNLAEAIYLDVIHKEYFKLNKPDPKALMRKGKVNYFLEVFNDFNFKGNDSILIFAIDISPIQQRNLERIYKIKILDKTSLILEIFGERAFSKIGKIQVELAHLNWQKSRLVRSWTHLERQRGGFGFLGGPGESQIELDKRMINKRIKQLKLLISGDQVLPKISSNVSVFPTEPLSNPLEDWLDSCHYIKERVPNDVLILPAHNEPFRGLHERLNNLINGHEKNLERLLDLCKEPKRAIDVFSVLFKRTISDDVLLMATGESIAHLNCLLMRNLINSDKDENGVIYYKKI